MFWSVGYAGGFSYSDVKKLFGYRPSWTLKENPPLSY